MAGNEDRIQFAFWLDATLGNRFRTYCEHARVNQRVAAEQALTAFLDSKSPRAGAPESAAVSSTFPAPDQGRGSDSRDGGK